MPTDNHERLRQQAVRNAKKAERLWNTSGILPVGTDVDPDVKDLLRQDMEFPLPITENKE